MAAPTMRRRGGCLAIVATAALSTSARAAAHALSGACPQRRAACTTPRVLRASAAPTPPDVGCGTAADPAADYHVPVMLRETIDLLVTDPTGVYVDGTLGGGGHSAALLDALGPTGGRVVGVDRDADAIAETSARLREHVDSGRLTPVRASFQFLDAALGSLELSDGGPSRGVSGILLDLGISSHQIDAGHRGFSFRHDAPLDMRMDGASALPSARDFLNGCAVDELVRVLREYGEEKYARPIARAILAARPLGTTGDLARAVSSVTPEHKRTKTLARVFQAVRILVNDELRELEVVLLSAARLVRPGGRLVVLSYHSLEDRRVKNVMRSGALDGRVVRDEMGNSLSPWRPVTRKPVVATDEEVRTNGRARSAKLRAAERTEASSDAGPRP